MTNMQPIDFSGLAVSNNRKYISLSYLSNAIYKKIAAAKI